MLNIDLRHSFIGRRHTGGDHRDWTVNTVQRSRIPYSFPRITRQCPDYDCFPIRVSGDYKRKQCHARPQSCGGSSRQWHRIYRCGNHHLPKADCTRTDYRCRNLGNCRYRTGSRRRNVHHRHCCHGIDPHRTGIT